MIEPKKCWCCKGEMELRHYPVEICPACHNAGGGVERRDLFRVIDEDGDVNYKERYEALVAKCKELIG